MAALGYALVIHAILFLPPILIALLMFLTMTMKKRTLAATESAPISEGNRTG